MSGGSARAYVDRPVGDLETAVRAASIAADVWHLEQPQLVRAGMNVIFTCGRTVLRVSAPTAPAEAAVELAQFWAERAVRVARPMRSEAVIAGGLSVTAWERIDAVPAPIDWSAVGTMVRSVHETDPGSLPPSVPIATPSVLPWWDFDALLERTESALDVAARRGLRAAIDRHTGWQRFGGEVLCHGDVHPGNVMMATGGPVLLDWDLLCSAPPGWDHAPMMTWAQRWGGASGEYEAFAHGYGRSLRDDPVAGAFAELRLVAATLMRVAAAMTDARASAEAERRLRYWRGDPDAPPWTAQ